MEWKTTSYATKDIKYKRKFVRYFLQTEGEKIVDIWCSKGKEMYFAYVLTENHFMWRYAISFMFENVEFKMDLFTTT